MGPPISLSNCLNAAPPAFKARAWIKITLLSGVERGTIHVNKLLLAAVLAFLFTNTARRTIDGSLMIDGM